MSSFPLVPDPRQAWAPFPLGITRGRAAGPRRTNGGREVRMVSHITAMELESLRHLIGECDLKAKKLSSYARQVQNPELREFCEREADSANRSKQTLMNFLNEGVSVQ
jgi:hypothetical protein